MVGLKGTKSHGVVTITVDQNILREDFPFYSIFISSLENFTAVKPNTFNMIHPHGTNKQTTTKKKRLTLLHTLPKVHP